MVQRWQRCLGQWRATSLAASQERKWRIRAIRRRKRIRHLPHPVTQRQPHRPPIDQRRPISIATGCAGPGLLWRRMAVRPARTSRPPHRKLPQHRPGKHRQSDRSRPRPKRHRRRRKDLWLAATYPGSSTFCDRVGSRLPPADRMVFGKLGINRLGARLTSGHVSPLIVVTHLSGHFSKTTC